MTCQARRVYLDDRRDRLSELKETLSFPTLLTGGNLKVHLVYWQVGGKGDFRLGIFLKNK